MRTAAMHVATGRTAVTAGGPRNGLLVLYALLLAVDVQHLSGGCGRRSSCTVVAAAAAATATRIDAAAAAAAQAARLPLRQLAPCGSDEKDCDAAVPLGGGRQLAAARRKRGPQKRRPSKSAPFVSTGMVRAFVGDVGPTPALALALANRAYQRELILITDSRPRMALQLFDNLAQLGLVHALLLTSGHSSCTALAKLVADRAALYGAQEGGAVGLSAATAQAQSSGGNGGGAQPAHRRHLSQDEGGGAATSPADLNTTVGLAALAAAAAGSNAGGRDSVPPLSSEDMIGCAWCSQRLPDGFVGHRRLMLKRVILLARIVRLGYNVLSLDTDVIVFRDPYPYLKSPPHASMNMIVGRSIRSGGIVNTGVMYFQNASRTGPVAWLLAEVVERNLRWIEHNVSMPRTAALGALPSSAAAQVKQLLPHQADTRGCWDQLLFGDVVLTGMSGKLVLMYCARPPTTPPARGGNGLVSALGKMEARRAEEENSWGLRHRAALGLGEKRNIADLMAVETTTVAGVQGMAALVGGQSYDTLWVNLTVPRDLQPLLPDEPGYSVPEVRPGLAAHAFQQLLAADAQHAAAARRAHRRVGRRRLSSVDPRLTAKEAWRAGASAQPRRGLQAADGFGSVERLAYAADWLIGGWPQRGALGYWDATFTNGRPRQVIGHLVRAPGPTSVGKDAVRMQYGEHNWVVAGLSAGGPFPFIGWPNATAAPRVVALLPEVDTTTQSTVQWSNTARGLAQVALLTGRQVVWPSVPCNSPWVQPNPGSRRALPFNLNLRFLAHGTLSPGGLFCTPASTFHNKCLYERHVVMRNDSATVGLLMDDEDAALGDGEFVTRVEGPRGLLPVEFAMMQRLLPGAAPGPHNTVHLQSNDEYEDSGDGGQVMFDEPPRTEGVTYVKAVDIAKPLREGPLAAQPVIYLAQRTFVTKLDKLNEPDLLARYRAFRNECPALK